MACGSKLSAEVFLQTKAAVVGSDSNAHVLSLFLFALKASSPWANRLPHLSHFCLQILIHPTRSGAIRQDHSAIRANTASWNRNISSLQACEHSCLFTAGHKPQHKSGAVDNRIRQRHASPSLVDSGERDVRIFDVEDRISRYQRRRVPIGSKSEVNKIEHGRRTGDLL